MTGVFGALLGVELLESPTLAPRQARLRRHPKRPVRRLRQGFDRGAGQPLPFAEPREARAVIAKQAVLRAHPQVASPVLEQALRRQIAQPLFLAVVFEAIPLGESRLNQARECQHAPNFLSPPGHP